MSGRRGGPTLRRRRLGAELRRYRDAAGLTIDRVAAQLGCSASKISRIETGQTGASPRDVRDMLVLYQVAEPELESLVEIAKGTRQRGWWRPYGSLLIGAYLGVEAAAHAIDTFDVQCLPGLLQTEEYARCLIAATQAELTQSEIADRVRVRLARQSILSLDEPVTLRCVIEEAALRRPVGGPRVMAGQLEHLLVAAERANVTLQVLPIDVGAHPGMDGSFVLLRFRDEGDLDTVYLTLASGGLFVEKPAEVARYAQTFDGLRELALPARASVDLITSLAKEPANREPQD